MAGVYDKNDPANKVERGDVTALQWGLFLMILCPIAAQQVAVSGLTSYSRYSGYEGSTVAWLWIFSLLFLLGLLMVIIQVGLLLRKFAGINGRLTFPAERSNTFITKDTPVESDPNWP